MQQNIENQTIENRNPKFKLQRFSENLIEPTLELLLNTYSVYHPLYTYLKTTRNQLIDHLLPVLQDTSCHPYSYIILENETQKVVAVAIQKDLSDLQTKEDRILSEYPSIAFKEQLCWSQLDRILEDYKIKCQDFKIDPLNEEILGNIYPKNFMYQIFTAVDSEYQSYRLGSFIQYSVQRIATEEGFVYMCTHLVNDRYVNIIQRSGGVLNHQIDLHGLEFQGEFVFRQNQNQRYLTNISICYKNPQQNYVLNKLLSQKMENILPSL